MTPLTVRENVSRRISFAKINEPLKVPNLLAIQTDSFDRLVGNERWAERLERRRLLVTILSPLSPVWLRFLKKSPRFVTSRRLCSSPSLSLSLLTLVLC